MDVPLKTLFMVALGRFVMKSDYFGKLLAFSRLMAATGRNGGKLRGNRQRKSVM